MSMYLGEDDSTISFKTDDGTPLRVPKAQLSSGTLDQIRALPTGAPDDTAASVAASRADAAARSEAPMPGPVPTGEPAPPSPGPTVGVGAVTLADRASAHPVPMTAPTTTGSALPYLDEHGRLVMGDRTEIPARPAVPSQAPESGESSNAMPGQPSGVSPSDVAAPTAGMAGLPGSRASAAIRGALSDIDEASGDYVHANALAGAQATIHRRDMAAIAQTHQQLVADYQKKYDNLDADEQKKSDDIMAQYGDGLRALGDARVDPKRLWATATTGQKIAGALAIALGSIGGALQHTGRNVALDEINQAIERDIDAQKTAIENQRTKLAGLQTLYGQNLQRFGNAKNALLASKAMALESVASQAQTIAESSQNDQYRANLSRESAMMRLQAAHLKAGLALSEENIDDRAMATIAKAQGAQDAGVNGAIDQMDQVFRDAQGVRDKAGNVTRPAMLGNRALDWVGSFARNSDASQLGNEAQIAAGLVSQYANRSKRFSNEWTGIIRNDLAPRPGDSPDTVERKRKIWERVKATLSGNAEPLGAPDGSED